LEFPLPAAGEIKAVERILAATGHSLSGKILDELVRSCQGLSMERIRRVLARAIATHGELQPEDVELVLEESADNSPNANPGILPTTEKISDIGGLDNLKDWLLRRGGAFRNGRDNTVCPIRVG
jgi:hypothetical protein